VSQANRRRKQRNKQRILIRLEIEVNLYAAVCESQHLNNEDAKVHSNRSSSNCSRHGLQCRPLVTAQDGLSYTDQLVVFCCPCNTGQATCFCFRDNSGITVEASDLQSSDGGFDSQSGRCQAT